MRKLSLASTVASLMLLTACQSVPRAPDSQIVGTRLPELEPMLGAREPDFTETMDCFLDGKLTCGSESAYSVIPATPATLKPKRR